MTDKTITLIRHGATASNERKAYIGITDEPLSQIGISQIKPRTYPEADIVFSSPLIRCIETANIIYPEKEINVINNLRETDFGIFEGKNYQDLSDNADYQAWIDSGGTTAFPGGESREEAVERSIDGFERVLNLSGEAKLVSVIAHGGTIMAILSHYFGGDYYSYHIENGEGYTFDLSHNGIFSGLHPGSFLR